VCLACGPAKPGPGGQAPLPASDTRRDRQTRHGTPQDQAPLMSRPRRTRPWARPALLRCARAWTRSERDHPDDPLSDGDRQVVKSDAEPVAGERVGGDAVVAAAQVLHERVTAGEDPH
jgi:hypothetical protein